MLLSYYSLIYQYTTHRIKMGNMSRSPKPTRIARRSRASWSSNKLLFHEATLDKTSSVNNRMNIKLNKIFRTCFKFIHILKHSYGGLCNLLCLNNFRIHLFLQFHIHCEGLRLKLILCEKSTSNWINLRQYSNKR